MPTSNRRRRTANLAQALLYSVIVIAILGTVNFLANRYDKSYDSTSNKMFTLSDQSIKIAKDVNQPVTITYWDRPNNFQNARDLLQRYSSLSNKITVSYQDVDKNRTQAIAAGVKSLPTIDVQVGNKKEEAKSLTEEDVTGAMVRALKGGNRTACFVLGSGEHSTDDTDSSGLSTAKKQTESSNYKTETIKLIPKADIPSDCTIVIVPGPRLDYLPAEADALKNYVQNGGRALFLLDPPVKFGQAQIADNTALTDVLKDWGVTVQKDIVLDTSGMGQLFGAGPEAPLVTSYDSQAIVRDMKDIPTVFPIARSLEVKNGDKTQVDKLFETTSDSFATTNLNSPEIRQSKNDLKGPLTLAAAGTYTTGKDNGNGRFVVVGNSAFITNGAIGFNGNRDLYLNMLNWLSSDEDLISIRPKAPADRPLSMNNRQMGLMFYSSVFGFPLLILAAGAGVWWRRR